MKLVIVESPSKAKTIEKYLGEPYVVRASVGHVRDLPKSNKKAIDIANDFEPHYEIVRGKEIVLKEIMSLAKKSDEVLLATDPDREGEAIAWHIKEAAKLKHPKRISFTEITKQAVLAAIEHPRAIDEDLRQAQEARRVLDRLVGYDLSGLIWKKIRYGLSAGRVQSPALRIIVEREREIQAFTPEQYFVLSALLETEKKPQSILFEYPKDIFDSVEAEKIYNASLDTKWNIADTKTTQVKKSAKPPFITSTLQQTASNRLGFSPSRTMMVAQKLYEAGHITYMRTDSPSLSSQAIGMISGYINSEYGKEYVEVRNYSAKGKNAQEAHEAIRPSVISKLSAGINEEQKKLYTLIWERTVASQMSDAIVERTKISASPQSDTNVIFTANGSQVVFDGWLKVHPDGSDDQLLPTLKVADILMRIGGEKKEKFTEPPGRYSEAGLVRELEKRGIGRPSTYATIIRTLEERGYVTKEQRTLMPTETGMVVSKFLEENFAEYISDSFTATMEDTLDNIADGKASYAKTLSDFYTPFLKDVKKKDKETSKLTDIGPAPEEFTCPVCGKSMVYKLSRNGKFMSCSTFPDCTGALTEDGKEMQKDTIVGKDPETGLDIILKDGKFGPYVQLGEKDPKTNPKPKRASVPPEITVTETNMLTVDAALKLLSLPRVIGTHPVTGKEIISNKGRFGPYIGHDGDFRSLKTDDVYTITLDRALEILAQEKKKRGWKKSTKKSS